MADYVATSVVTFDDQVSDGANAAADALSALADAADNADASVSTISRTSASYTRQLDPLSTATAGLAKALALQAAAQASLSDAVARGQITQDSYQRSMDTAGAKVDLARAKLAALRGTTLDLNAASAATGPALAGVGTAADGAGGHLTTASANTAGMTRELIVMADEVLNGRFTRIPGSMLVLAEHSSTATSAIQAIGAAAASSTGVLVALGAAAVAGLALAAYQAESAARALDVLQTKLSLTRDDYAAMATEVQQAAQAAAGSTPGLGSADALAAATTIGSSRYFTGSQADLQGLVVLADQLSVALGDTVPAAASKLAAALKDPAAAAKALESDGLRTMNESLVTTITRLQDSGDATDAATLVIDAYKAAIGDAASKMTPLQQALHDLGQALHDSSQDGQTFGQSLGTAIVNGLAGAISAVASLTSGVKGLLATKPLIDSATGLPVLASPANTDAQRQLYALAEQQGYSPALADFGSRVMHRESSDGTNPAAGNNVMQLSGSLAAQGATTAGSISGGLAYLKTLLDKYNGDFVLAAMAYNWGPTNVDAMLKAGNAAPQSVVDYATATSGTSGVAAHLAQLGVTGITPTTSTASASAAYGSNQNLMDQALTKAGSVGSIGQTRDSLQDTLDLLTKAQALTVTGSDDWQKLEGAIEKTQASITSTRDPIQTLIHGLDDQVAALGSTDGATRALAASQQKLLEAAQAAGRDPTAAEQAQVQADTLAVLSAAYGATLDGVNRQVAAQQALAPVYAAGTAAVQDATNAQKANEEARKDFANGTPAQAAAIQTLTAAYDSLTAAQGDNATRAGFQKQNDELDMLNTEISLIGATTEARNKELAVLKERQTLLEAGRDLESEASKQDLANAAARADAATELAQKQSAVNDLASMATQAFDQVGQAITSAFTNGSASSVNFGNIFRSVIASVLQEVAKLAVLNPALNAAFGGSNTTLADVASAAGGSSGGVSLSGLGQLGGLANSVSGALGGPSLTSLLGGNSLSSLLGIQVISPTSLLAGGASTAGATAGLTVPLAAADNFATAAPGATGATLGGLLSGVGLGAGAGALLNTLIGGKSLGGTVGSGVGAAAGAALGSVVPGVGTIIGGVLGGLLGGAGGGLFGAPARNSYQNTQISVGADGLFGVSGTVQQVQDASSTAAATAAALTQLNQFLQANGVTATQRGVVGNIGNGIKGLSQGTGLDTSGIDSNVTYSAAGNPTLDAFLEGRGFDSLSDLVDGINLVTTTIPQLTANLGTFHDAALDATNATADQVTVTAGTTDKYDASLDSINTTYEAAIASAQKFGISTDDLSQAWADATQTLNDSKAASLSAIDSSIAQGQAAANGNPDLLGSQLSSFDAQAAQQRQTLADNLYTLGVQGDDASQREDALNAELATQRQNLVTAFQTNYNDTVTELTDSLAARNYTAQATIAGTSTPAGIADTNAAALANQQDQQLQEQVSVRAQLVALGMSAADVAAQMQVLATTQQAETQALIASQDAARQAAAGTASNGITSLLAYATKLQTGSTSPLSPTDQYALAGQQFNAVAGAAAQGDANSISNLSTYADSYLATSQAVNGSGTAYAADFDRVVAALENVAAVGPDTLTASVLQAATVTQTQTLVAQLQALQAEVVSLRLAVTQGALAPARIAA